MRLQQIQKANLMTHNYCGNHALDAPILNMISCKLHDYVQQNVWVSCCFVTMFKV